MISFYFNILIKNKFKAFTIFLMFLGAQYLYDSYHLNKNYKVNTIRGQYNELVKYDIEFYKYLREINEVLGREDKDLFHLQDSFEELIRENLQNIFFLELNNLKDYSFFPLNEPFDFYFQTDKNKDINQDKIQELEDSINDLFIRSYYNVASDTIFNLRNIPKINYIVLNKQSSRDYEFSNNLLYKIIISIALAFCVLIIFHELNSKKNNNINNKNFWAKIIRLKK